MRFLIFLSIIFSFLFTISFALIPEISPDLECTFCLQYGYEARCDYVCNFIPSIPNSSTQNSYPIVLDLDHTFSSSHGNMYLALLSPYGEIINTNTDSIGTSADDSFETNSAYTSVSIPVSHECSYGPGPYNLLVHTNPIEGKATPYTSESNLYSCSSLIDLLDEITVPESWTSNHEILIYCSIIDSNEDVFSSFNLNLLKNSYSSCVIKNLDEDQSIVYGMQYGSTVENDYGSINFSTIEEVQSTFNSDTICTKNENEYTCIIKEQEYIFTYSSLTNIFQLYSSSLDQINQSLHEVVSYTKRIENPYSNSILLKHFNGEEETGKMIVGYEIPKDFFRENSVTQLSAINEDLSFDFDSNFLIHYKNFGDISSYCYESLRSQTQSVSTNDLITIINSSQERAYFDTIYQIACFNEFIFLNSQAVEFKTLYKNLVFDTQFGEMGIEKDYIYLFQGNSIGNQQTIISTSENSSNVGLNIDGEFGVRNNWE